MYFHDTKVLLRAYQNPQNASPSPRVSLECPCLPPRGRSKEGECESSLYLTVAATNKKLHAGSFHRKRSPFSLRLGHASALTVINCHSPPRRRFATSRREVKGRRMREFSLPHGCGY